MVPNVKVIVYGLTARTGAVNRELVWNWLEGKRAHW